MQLPGTKLNQIEELEKLPPSRVSIAKKITNLKPKWLMRYLIALAGVGLGFLIRWSLTLLVGPGLPTYITFYPFVMIVALMAGFGPGIMATFLMAVMADLWLFYPQWTFFYNSAVDTVGQIFFLSMGIFMSLIAELYRYTRRHLEEMVYSRTLKLNQVNQWLEQEIKLRGQAMAEIIETQEKLRQARYYLESLFNYANAPIIVWDPKLNITKFNHAFEHLTGYKEQEVIGHNLKILFPLDSQEESLIKIEQTSAGENWEAVEIPIQNQNGEIRTVLWNSANIHDQNGEAIIATIAQGQDITRLKGIDKAKSEFISLASHQLRTPLSSISLSSELLLRGISGDIDPKQKSFIEEIFFSTQRMAELISDLLNITKIEMGTFEVRLQPVDLIEFTDYILAELKLQISNKELTLVKNYGAEKIGVDFDKNILRATIENLVTNAIQYTPAGGRITITIQEKNEAVLIQVADTGLGVPLADQEKVFEKLFRAPNAKKINESGTGLGLYIVKSLLDQAGSKLWLESEENQGSTFSVLIPINTKSLANQ